MTALVIDGYKFNHHKTLKRANQHRWKCNVQSRTQCKVYALVQDNVLKSVFHEHNHPPKYTVEDMLLFEEEEEEENEEEEKEEEREDDEELEEVKEKEEKPHQVKFLTWNNEKTLIIDGYKFNHHKDLKRNNQVRWKCNYRGRNVCKVYALAQNNELKSVFHEHNHPPKYTAEGMLLSEEDDDEDEEDDKKVNLKIVKEKKENPHKAQFLRRNKTTTLVIDGYKFNQHKILKRLNRVRWKCNYQSRTQCKVYALLLNKTVKSVFHDHNHPPTCTVADRLKFEDEELDKDDTEVNFEEDEKEIDEDEPMEKLNDSN